MEKVKAMTGNSMEADELLADKNEYQRFLRYAEFGIVRMTMFYVGGFKFVDWDGGVCFKMMTVG